MLISRCIEEGEVAFNRIFHEKSSGQKESFCAFPNERDFKASSNEDFREAQRAHLVTQTTILC